MRNQSLNYEIANSILGEVDISDDMVKKLLIQDDSVDDHPALNPNIFN